MGFDTSFHPIDTDAMGLLTAYIAGEVAPSAVAPFVARAVEVRRIRYRAKAWALAAKREGALDRALHVWGRPFLTAGDSPREVIRRVHQWQDATIDRADDLARDNLAAIWRDDPDVDWLIKHSHPGDDHLTGDFAAIAEQVMYQVERLRNAVVWVRAGRRDAPAIDSDGAYSHAELLADANFLALMDLVVPTPGWMSRGHTWPSQVVGTLRPFPLGDALAQRVGGFEVERSETITGNYQVGGYLPPGRLAALPTEVSDVWVDAVMGHTGFDRAEVVPEVTKLVESAAYARRLGYGWCEATEIYSGLDGRMN